VCTFSKTVPSRLNAGCVLLDRSKVLVRRRYVASWCIEELALTPFSTPFSKTVPSRLNAGCVLLDRSKVLVRRRYVASWCIEELALPRDD
jgi:hypothetical protein